MHERRHEAVIQRWVDGEPAGGDRGPAQRLAASCPDCARLARSLRATRALLRAIPEPRRARPDLPARVLAAIRGGEARRVAREDLLPVLHRTAALAAATLAVTALLALYRLSGPATRSGELSATTSESRAVREVVTRHVVFHEIGGGEVPGTAGAERK